MDITPQDTRRAAIRAAREAHTAEIEAWARSEERKGRRIKAAMAALELGVPPHPGNRHRLALEAAYDGPIPPEAMEGARLADEREAADWRAKIAAMSTERAA